MRYAVVYIKGGVGKTTLGVHLAAHFARSAPTLMIDGDPQESAATWAAWRREHAELAIPTTVRLRGKAILDEGRALADNYQNTVVDAGGRDGAGLRNALLLADRVLMPIGISGVDAAVLDEFLELVSAVQDINRNLRLKAVINRIHPNSSDGELRDFLIERGVSAFPQVIHERRVFQHAIGDGRTVEEFKPKSAAANHEMGKLYDQLKEW